MKQQLLILSLFLLLIGCGDSSNQQPKEKAERLSQQAEVELNKLNYEEAERLLSESINIYTESNNETKLTENYSSLSTTQVLSGKLSLALESLIALRSYYKSAADRSNELQTMIQLGNIYFQLGKKREALSILNETFNNSQLYQLGHIRAKAAVDIASIYASTNYHETAIQYLKTAEAFYETQKDTTRVIETECLLIHSLSALKKNDEAIATYRTAKSLLVSNTSAPNEPLFYLRCGEAFALLGEFSFAKMNFEQGLELIAHQSKYQNSAYAAHLQIGLGELYFHNIAFEEAQLHYTKAYETAKNEQNSIVLGYLLVRIADCISKRAAYHGGSFNNGTDGMIQATQLY